MYLARALLRDEADDCRLGTLAERFQFEHRPSHRAFEDAAATVDLLHLLIERSSSFGVVGLDDLCALPALAGHRWAAKLRHTAGLPRSPGVYTCVDDAGTVVWVGGADDLRRDVRSLFSRHGGAVHASVLRDTCGWQVRHVASPFARDVAVQRLLHTHRPRLQRREHRGRLGGPRRRRDHSPGGEGISDVCTEADRPASRSDRGSRDRARLRWRASAAWSPPEPTSPTATSSSISTTSSTSSALRPTADRRRSTLRSPNSSAPPATIRSTSRSSHEIAAALLDLLAAHRRVRSAQDLHGHDRHGRHGRHGRQGRRGRRGRRQRRAAHRVGGVGRRRPAGACRTHARRRRPAAGRSARRGAARRRPARAEVACSPGARRPA